ncbi:sulfatase [Halococcoides cellulosivorans]|uniref:Arylsulfatase n=1 Tax=Halococcoides cellulosivorans TaxID=1679096 RepID=A0A2R4X3B6_9EURY|nr:sulfatase [Halococcoides cellulosivorans]AWB28173.1 arylsulfatase [Halococcoides cellulosivorans]
MSDDRPNIVLVTIDSLRADHCGFMGYDEETTPTLDAMASDGLVFENAVAPGPATPESMPVIFTGQWPVDRETDADSTLVARRERIRSHMEARETLPETLQRRGYTTGAFTPNPFTSRHFGFDQGFDQFEDFMDESNRGRLYQRVFDGFLDESRVSSLARVFMNVWQREEVFKPWESYYDDAVSWASNTDEPYFLWVFLMDAHNPYMSDSEFRHQSRIQEFHANFEFWRQSHETPFSDGLHDKLVTAYDDSIRYSDAFLGQLREDLDDAIVAVHGDHGEAFGEHGFYGHEPYLHDENVHVPFVVDGVDDRTVSETVSLRELPSFLGALADGSEPAMSSAPGVRVWTRDGSAVLVEADGERRIVDTSAVSGAWTEGDDPIDALAERFRTHLAEQSRIADATATLARTEQP